MKKILLLGAVFPVLFLSACGEGWETKLYDAFPYGNVRTAGYGVEYVRAAMMPEKGPVLVREEPAPSVVVEEKEETGEASAVDEKDQTDAVLNSGEKFFRDLQKK